VAERYILSARFEILNHVVIFNGAHLMDLMKSYVDYYNKERPHLTLDRNSPDGREIQNKPSKSAKIIALPRLGGLHHKYEWREAA
jgi:hypothetical protein